MRRTLITLVLSALALVAGLSIANPAYAVTADQRLTLINSFTQANSGSYNSWNWARTNQGAYADYSLDWSTDYCSASPDQPLGFDFRIPCWRHDFGYRNYKRINQFPGNKDHVDSAFYFDLKAKCATYNVVVRPACYSLAWTYYEAVHNFGSLAVTKAQLDAAAAYKTALERSGSSAE